MLMFVMVDTEVDVLFTTLFAISDDDEVLCGR